MARHRNLTIRILAVIVVLVGLHRTGWVVYNLFIDAQPSFMDSSATSAGTSLVIGVLMVMLGGLMLAWYKPVPRRIDADGLTPAVEDTLRELLGQDRKSEAVEAYRAATGADQQAAEIAVERYNRAA
ncbi:MAG: hypothetical protein ACYSU7_15415 [Planctomycetota bacterium]|jgi:high-affinity nickel permease